VGNENGSPGFFSGLIFGSIIGLIAGILIAPQPGEQSREQLRSKLDEFTSLGKAAWEEGKEAATQKGSEMQAKFKQARSKRE
jgi:gas vesicle protein